MFFTINFGENIMKKRSIEERKSYCDKWRSSGLSTATFCKENHLSKSVLYKWLKLYDNKLSPPNTKKQDLKFLAIDPVAVPIKLMHVEVILPNGLLLKAEVESLSKLIQELSR
jgi:hypothetical protein